MDYEDFNFTKVIAKDTKHLFQKFIGHLYFCF